MAQSPVLPARTKCQIPTEPTLRTILPQNTVRLSTFGLTQAGTQTHNLPPFQSAAE